MEKVTRGSTFYLLNNAPLLRELLDLQIYHIEESKQKLPPLVEGALTTPGYTRVLLNPVVNFSIL